MASRVKKPADISQEDWESVDVPEATDAEFASARPFKEVFPELYREWKKMGRPPVANPKVHIGFRLAAMSSRASAPAAAATTPASKGCCATHWRKVSFEAAAETFLRG